MSQTLRAGPARFSCWECGAVYQRLAPGLYRLIAGIELEDPCRHPLLHGTPQ